MTDRLSTPADTVSLPTAPLPTGFIALHGNRTETLLDTVAGWLAAHPLAPLEPEIVLVQSNGMAEWVKMALARQNGICAAARVQLPARFQWHTYRQVLGRAQVPARSPLDKTTLAWRLMRLLPSLIDAPGFAPIAAWLTDDSPGRRFQLAQRIADLYDQYQVHRPDWLEGWANGEEQLRDAGAHPCPIPDDQRWQARLWLRLLDELDTQQIALIRPQLHRRVLDRLTALSPAEAPAACPGLPRRVVLFGMTHVPLPMLELLSALSQHSQVLLAIPNPCRYHWADIMDGREWLRIARRRQPLRDGHDLQQIELDAMHLHAHPLLAAWGRQARDFVRQLDHFDDVEQTRAHFPLARIDLFDDEPADTAPLLLQVQRHIRDLLPLGEHPRSTIPAEDRSIVFHIAHSPVRELEILHDQLLDLLAAPPGGQPLHPRDIVVMVPAIDQFAPAIRAVFGQYGRHDPRHIPFDIADLSARAGTPLLAAVEWLLRLPHDRCRLSELCGLLDVPAIAARFAIDEDGVPRLAHWMRGAGIRWGLDASHRAGLALEACGEQNSALFGLRRMLMGYAVGQPEDPARPYAGIEPYDEVGGLDAELAGALANLLDRLIDWQHTSRQPVPPADWATRLRALLAALVLPRDDTDRQTLAALHSALEHWVSACDDAGFDQPLPLEVAADAWLATLDTPALERRFRAGGVTFCTLMPMRAIPFEVVCLLGMNDGDYPRRTPRSDFDLMALPGQQRPGDRARRDDDRQLMLEALLSARRVLHVSWCGRSVRDNSEQPPSVLVAQLRDYLAAGWSPEVVATRTTEHPLQPFSRRYFETGTALRTWAREWRAAHTEDDSATPDAAAAAGTARPPTLRQEGALSVAQLARFLRNPVKHFFQQRLGVDFGEADEALPDDESFSLAGLEEYGLVNEVSSALLADLAALPPAELPQRALDRAVDEHLQRIARSGRLPMGGLGTRQSRLLSHSVLPMMQAWRQARCTHSLDLPHLPLQLTHAGTTMEDWLAPRIAAPNAPDTPQWMRFTASRLLDKKQTLRPDKLFHEWVLALLAASSGAGDAGLLIGRDARLHIRPMAQDSARHILGGLIEVWQEGLNTPLPVAPGTAFALLNERDPATHYDGNHSDYNQGEVSDPYLARCYPDFEALGADGRFESLAHTLYAPLLAWVQDHVEVHPHAPATGSGAPTDKDAAQ